MLDGRSIALGVTGGIAAYKAVELVRLLRKQNARVVVVMTKNACRFVAPLTFETLSGERVLSDPFDYAYDMAHIALAKRCDALIVAPATANIIAKIACGIGDDLLSTAALSMSAKPLLIAPAMNTAMYQSPATQDNLARLAARGVRFVGPAAGLLACGDADVGRMSEPSDILAAAVALFAPQDLTGKRLLVTAGPTREALDPVRFLSNRSSGKMGYELAAAAQARGASVTLVSGPVALDPPAGVRFVPITCTQELFEAVTKRFPDCDAVIQAAAPADYTPAHPSTQKIKKQGDALSLELVRTPDVAQTLGLAKRPDQVLVAFAAETENLLDNARAKLARKRCDLIVANDVTQPGAGFSVDTNRVTLIEASSVRALPLLTKRAVADQILDRVAELLREHA